MFLTVRLQPVPCGVTGDLYIGGDGLARGYLGSAGTDRRKICGRSVSRFGSGTPIRLAIWLATAQTGRSSSLAAKIIRSRYADFASNWVRSNPALLLIPRSDKRSLRPTTAVRVMAAKPLVAYFNYLHDAPNTSDLRDFLRRNLPDYMLPSVFVPLDDLPLNAAGKVDRDALPQPDSARPDLRAPLKHHATAPKRNWLRFGHRFSVWMKSVFMTTSLTLAVHRCKAWRSPCWPASPESRFCRRCCFNIQPSRNLPAAVY